MSEGERYYSGASGPAEVIRPMALCLFRRPDGAILVAPGYDPVKRQLFYRPLGGEIDFGERAVDAVRREIREELGADIESPRLLGVCENIFTFVGKSGHELIWLFEAAFSDPAYYEGEVLTADEHGSAFEAHWVPLQRFQAGEAPLYPDGLLELLGTSS